MLPEANPIVEEIKNDWEQIKCAYNFHFSSLPKIIGKS